MIKLKSLLLEDSEPIDSDQWDNWTEYIEYFEDEIKKSEISKLIERHRLNYESYLNNMVSKLYDKTESIYLGYDSDETFSWIKDINQWVYDNSDKINSFGINPDNIYNVYVERSLNGLKKSPGKVYHYTTEDKWENIRRDSKMVGSSGTGINNRGAHGIFTSVDPEEYTLGTYGDICLEINLEQFKLDSGLLELDLEFEPEIVDYLNREYLWHALKVESRDDMPSDISPYTVIVRHTIPLNYIKQI